VNCSLSYPNTRGSVSRSEPLVMKLNDLRVSIQLLSTSSKASLFLATRARRMPFLLRRRFSLLSLLLWRCLHLQGTSDFSPGLEPTVSKYSRLNSFPGASDLPPGSLGERHISWPLYTQTNDLG
jgi:hypothetical protein